MSILTLFKKKKADVYPKEFMTFVVERLKPWIVLNCLEKENYIITDKQAEEISIIIINQAFELNAFEKVMKKLGVTI